MKSPDWTMVRDGLLRLVTIANKERELMARYMAELGLTPSSRSRLAVPIPTEPEPWKYDAYAAFETK